MVPDWPEPLTVPQYPWAIVVSVVESQVGFPAHSGLDPVMAKAHFLISARCDSRGGPKPLGLSCLHHSFSSSFPPFVQFYSLPSFFLSLQVSTKGLRSFSKTPSPILTLSYLSLSLDDYRRSFCFILGSRLAFFSSRIRPVFHFVLVTTYYSFPPSSPVACFSLKGYETSEYPFPSELVSETGCCSPSAPHVGMLWAARKPPGSRTSKRSWGRCLYKAPRPPLVAA